MLEGAGCTGLEDSQVTYVPLPEAGIMKLSHQVRQGVMGTSFPVEERLFLPCPSLLISPTPSKKGARKSLSRDDDSS